MKVLHLVDEPYDSGIVHYALTLASGLLRRGHSVQVWGQEGKAPLEEARRLGLPTRGVPRGWPAFSPLRRALRAGEADFLVAHTGSAHLLAVAAAAGLPGRVPVVRTRGDARRLRRRPGGGLLWGRTSGFAAANASILEEQRRLYGRPDLPARVVYQGLSDPGPVRPPPEGDLTIGIVGRLDPVKGHAALLEAFRVLSSGFPRARCLIVGRDENLRAEDLRRLAAALGVAERVELTGHVPDALQAMRRCHIGVVSSLGSEAVSRAAVEWMAVGRPLVATKVGCLPEYLEDGVTGLLVPPGDPSRMGKALVSLAADGALRARMGARGRERYERMFTLERFLTETERLYDAAFHAVPSR